jgi:hypothetical protein
MTILNEENTVLILSVDGENMHRGKCFLFVCLLSSFFSMAKSLVY